MKTKLIAAALAAAFCATPALADTKAVKFGHLVDGRSEEHTSELQSH